MPPKLILPHLTPDRIAVFLAALVPQPNGCRTWPGPTDPHGYGLWRLDDTTLFTHRVACVLHLRAEIPPGQFAGHACHDRAAAAGQCAGGVCEHRACSNPDHLRPMTPAANTLASIVTPAAQHARVTTCPAGHPLAGRNLSPAALKRGQRVCLACQRQHSKDLRALLTRAADALGITPAEYAARYGRRQATARAIIKAHRQEGAQ